MSDTQRGGGLSGLAIRRPVFTTMMMVLLVVLGIFGYRGLAIDQFPDVDLPVVTVQTVYPGASAETIEREVSRRMEEAFNPVEGVDRITSVSLEGVSQVVVEFDLGRDVDVAAQDVRTKIETIRRDLPEDIESPVVQKLDPGAAPILSLALSSETLPLVDLTTLADEDVRRALESVSGVGEVRLAGGLAREIRVNLLPGRLQALGVTVPEVMGALQRQNLEVPAGRVEAGANERIVRVTGRITDAAQFADVIVATRGGQPVRLADVARVEVGNEEERSLALVDGERAVAIDLVKVSGANTVAVADEVQAALARLRTTLPAGVELSVIRDNSVQIRHSVEDVIHELVIGAALTIVIVMLFLNDWKATAITSLALPVSVVSSFVLMSALGFTLNMLTLMALSLSIGILIDDAIVVVENIVRHREMGRDHFTAARTGTREIVLAVLATTLAIVAVFAPVAFMKGIVGRFFFQFGLTVAWAVLVSLFVSFTLTPMLSAWWGVNPHTAGAGRGNALTRTIARFNVWFDRQAGKYRGVVTWALGHRRATMAIAAASLVGAFALVPFIGGSFLPETDNSEFVVQFETPEGQSLGYTRGKATEAIAALRALPEVDYTYATVGAGATGTVTAGEIYVKLRPTADRERSQQEVMVAARERLGALFGVRTSVLVAGGVGGARAPLAIEVRGPDVAELQRLSALAMAEVKAVPGVVDVQSSLGDPKPEYRITLDREVANRVGLDVGQAAATIRPLMAGETATRWEDPSGEERDVVVQVAPEFRRSLVDVGQIPVPTAARGDAGVATVPLRDVARIEEGTAPAQIDRKDLSRIVTISGNTAPELSLQEASTQIQARLATLQLPAGYTISLGGDTEQLAETGGYVVETLVLAVILIFLILASQFESFTQPVAIMLSLPLSLVGVLLALKLTGSTLNMMSMIGVIMLMGLVVKNAILLVDNANERRAGGADRFAALVEAGAVRLRPIVMTTLAMVVGMIPVALGTGEGGGFRAPMARAVIGGLITSTLLTLIVVPVAYTYLDDLGSWFKRRLVSPDREREIAAERESSGLAPEPAWGD
ncbi:efflux RND transporter permease subunit [Roseisolibacter sp. H3M3-2]|uniref:efflux RND transporter permease subunit n=1 Tax=Roseisolibacter sp. H3M3-2 TaxID=3031323 RepID=UPI0023DC3DF0|nr:efflux RND transporter permease subunit [Roseisolibacter sp. H3M3-2]MDF1503392.1 efflux RND transporter permease subunit [Roseisolibacter sp. H3M3-2]